MPFPAPTHYRFTPHPIEDREFWDSIGQRPQLRGFLNALDAIAQNADEPSRAQASDYLAAKRTNNRKPLDTHWHGPRETLTALAVRRLRRGIEADDNDDTLMNWLWATVTEPTWVMSAHLPGNDLPDTRAPQFDLAACEMVSFLAEFRETLGGWIAAQSDTLGDTIIAELDRRLLTPYGEGLPMHWQDGPNFLNWTGVCAGSILTACESLAAQGHPRPAARERALQGVLIYFDKAFTAGGECDEGLGYWTYGMEFAIAGLSRLSAEELSERVGADRLQLLASYPRRAHLWGNNFFTGNDGPLNVAPTHSLLSWLSAATGEKFLLDWILQGTPDADNVAANADFWSAKGHGWNFSQAIRVLGAPDYDELNSALPADAATAADNFMNAQILDDQQTIITRVQTARGELIATLSGGHNAERHNHNDLGHFNLALDKNWILFDMGAPVYTSDFFREKRYTYVCASSRGHNCPLIGGHEQRAGRDAAGVVLNRDPDNYILDLTAAYSLEAELQKWTRALRKESNSFVIADEFETAPKTEIAHRMWSLCEPIVGTSGFTLGDLGCELSPEPSEIRIEATTASALGLRISAATPMWCINAIYATDASGQLQVETRWRAD